jgi:MraZ protein
MEEKVRGLGSDIATTGVFVNSYVHALDAKKRLTIPSDWREVAGVPNLLLVLPGVNDQCLCVYPAREIARRMERLRSLSIADERGRQFARTLASRAEQVLWDTQGRIRIKDDLLAYAGLVNEVVLVGTFEGFELWSPEKWKQQQSSATQSGLGEAARYVGF